MTRMQRLLPLLLALVWVQSAFGVSVTNGDFGTGDFTGWTLDTDGFPGTANDFQVVGSPGDYQAEIRADYWSTPGDIASTPLNDVFVANTLYQELDTALSPGSMMRLTFDWVFAGEDGDPASGDVFSVALHDGMDNLYGADGTLGFLVHPKAEYGSGSFSARLDRGTFANAAGWFLGFQLQVGVTGGAEPNGLGSSVQIGNVSLTEVAGAPTPPSFALVLPGLALVLAMRISSAQRGLNRFLCWSVELSRGWPRPRHPRNRTGSH